jgi:putative transposase
MRALKIKIRGLKKPQFERLKELTHHAKNLYNQTLWTLREAFEATGMYFSYFQMDKAMKQVTNLSGEVNYKLLKSKVAQQTLRRLDKNFLSFFGRVRILKIIPASTKGNQGHLGLNRNHLITWYSTTKRLKSNTIWWWKRKILR